MRSSIIDLPVMSHSDAVGTSALLSRTVRTTLAIVGLLVIAAPANALIIRDQCNQTSGDGQGNSCPPGDYLLIRPQYPSGVCGDWICCPANGDGSYNCDKAVNPTRSTITGALKNLLGPRATVLEPTRPSGMPKPVLPGMKAPIQRRGIEGEPAGTGSEHPSDISPERK